LRHSPVLLPARIGLDRRAVLGQEPSMVTDTPTPPDDAAEPQTGLSDHLRLYLVVAIAGAFAGLVAAGFHRLLDLLAERRKGVAALAEGLGLPGWLVAAVLGVVLVAIAVWLVRRMAPEASGSGIQEIEGTLQGRRRMHWPRLLPVKFASGATAIAGGLVLGREGPLIHMGGAIGAMFGALVRFQPHFRRILIASGAGAGLAAAFNAPLAGILFVTEEMRNEFRYTFVSFQSVVLACISATVVNDWWLGEGLSLPIQSFAAPPLGELPLYALLGVLMGGYGVLFNGALLRALDGTAALMRRNVGLTVAGAGVAIGLVVWFAPDAAGGGEYLIEALLADERTLGGVALLLFMRTITSVGSYSVGTPGGIFAPMLALGTLSGMTFAKLVALVPFVSIAEPGAFTVAAMGALFAATVRAPVTGVILVLELTGNYDMALPIIITCLLATFTAEALGGKPVYRLLLERTMRLKGDPQGR
jgi:H+/Cl- antiporter ClcA